MDKPLNVHTLFLEIFSLYVTLLPRDQYLLQIIQFILEIFTQQWLISPCHRVLRNRMFMVRLLISFGFKVSLCVENVYVFFAWSRYSMDKFNKWIADEIDVTLLRVRYWKVRFFHRLKVLLLQLYIYTRWSSWHEGVGCQAAVLISHQLATSAQWKACSLHGTLQAWKYFTVTKALSNTELPKVVNNRSKHRNVSFVLKFGEMYSLTNWQ